MKGKEGTILVTTLWILALLTLLALGIGIKIGVDIKLVGFFLNTAKARHLADAGLKKTIALIEEDDDKNLDMLNEKWSSGFDIDDEEYVLKDIKLGEGSFTVYHEAGKDEEGNPVYLYGASDEEGNLNINEIGGGILMELPGFDSETAAAVLDWRDEDTVAGNHIGGSEGAEDEYYRGMEAPYECKDAPFSAPEELLLVRGVTDEIYEGVKGIITVYGEDKKVNINTAPQEVFAVLVGGEFEELPGKIIAHRNGADGIAGTDDDERFTDPAAILSVSGLNQAEYDRLNILLGNSKSKEKYFKVNSNTFRVVSQGSVKNGKVKKTIEAVVSRGKEGTGILYYYED